MHENEMDKEIRKCMKKKYTIMRCKWLKGKQKEECRKKVTEYCKKHIMYKKLKEEKVFMKLWLSGISITLLGIITTIKYWKIPGILITLFGLGTAIYWLLLDFKDYESIE